MFYANAPKTIEAARAHRYNQWAGHPEGTCYDEGFCAMEVWPSDWRGMPHQCSRRNGHGPGCLYCKQHGRKVEAVQQPATAAVQHEDTSHGAA